MSKDFKKAANGLYWTSIEKVFQFVFRFVVTTILAREIGPAAFGIVALVIVFEYVFLYLMDMGFNQVLIQHKDLSGEAINTAYAANVFLGLLLTIVFYNSAPLIANFFNEALLKPVVQLMSLKIFFIAFSRIHIALLEKEFNFKRFTQISVPVRFISGSIGIVLVFQGFGVWAYIYYNLLQALLTSLAFRTFSGHKPKLQFSYLQFKEMLPLGFQFSTTRILNVFSEKLYYIVIGKYFDTLTLGLFQRADVIRRSSSEEFSSMFNRVLFPLYSKAKDYSESLFQYHKNVFPFYCAFFSTMCFLLVGFSDELIFVLLGNEWEASALFLKYLAILGFVNCLNLYCAMIRKSTAEGKALLKEVVFERSLRLILLFASLPYGVVGVLLGQIFGATSAFAYRSYRLKHFFSVNLVAFLQATFLPFLTIMVGFILFNNFDQVALTLTLGIIETALLKVLIGLLVSVLTLLSLRLFYFREFNFLQQLILGRKS